MAWYALYKWFIPWRKIPYTNWIKWYRKHLYSEWFKSLTDVEQKTELERQQKIREERKHNTEIALAKFGWLYSFMNEVTYGRMDEYMEVAKYMNKISIHSSKYW